MMPPFLSSISRKTSVMTQSLPLLGSRMNPNALMVSSPLPPTATDQCVGPGVTTSLTVGRITGGGGLLPASGGGGCMYAGDVSAAATIDTLMSIGKNPEWKKLTVVDLSLVPTWLPVMLAPKTPPGKVTMPPPGPLTFELPVHHGRVPPNGSKTRTCSTTSPTSVHGGMVCLSKKVSVPEPGPAPTGTLCQPAISRGSTPTWVNAQPTSSVTKELNGINIPPGLVESTTCTPAAARS